MIALTAVIAQSLPCSVTNKVLYTVTSDQPPTGGSKSLLFVQRKDLNETWVPLLEKLYSKVHGGYSSLAGGWTGEWLEGMAGGVTAELATSEILDTDAFQRKKMSKANGDFLFGTSTGHLESVSGERDGITEARGYIILGVRSLKSDHRLVEMHNSWGDSRKVPPVVGSINKKRSDKDKGEVRQPTPSTSPDTKSESSPPSPKRFFTDDGDHALLAFTLHLSRRTANLEEMRRRCPIVVENDTAQPLEVSNQSPSSLNPSLPDDNLSNSPPPKELAGPRASQESYGGDWVDDCADELWLKVPH
ncbi:calpain [Fusarium albosuccineum]|uniref:Calpain n=1 Tax=Fusarium albosuccineum TaxID=1237068 RepID=A0A8H4LFM3_9HYPO|nr:calpain [Fusarium albosuccineum]